MTSLLLIIFVAGVTANMDCSKFEGTMWQYGSPEEWKIISNDKIKIFEKSKTVEMDDEKLAIMFATTYQPDNYMFYINQGKECNKKAINQNDKTWPITKCVIFRLYTQQVSTSELMNGVKPLYYRFRESFRPPCLDEKKTKKRKEQREEFSLLAVGMEYYFQLEAKEKQIYYPKEVFHGIKDVCFDYLKTMYRKNPLIIYGPMSTSSNHGTAQLFAGGGTIKGQGRVLVLKPLKSEYPPIDVGYATGAKHEGEYVFWNGNFKINEMQREISKLWTHDIPSFNKDCIKKFKKLEKTCSLGKKGHKKKTRNRNIFLIKLQSL
eukprot:201311_1